ncbi:MAG: tetratricopeptide repeat protein [Anaerolineae bacterium]|nr:tetratricopeptide repeat protein [Anaerolineae bacterium]
MLADTRALLVLDDVWNGNALAEFMKATPRQMPILVTSRQRFPLDEIIEVNELRPDEALELLNFHVRRHDFTTDPDAKRLCDLLGYHAFALEIAGKSLKVYDLTPSALLSRIEDAPHDLNMPANFGELGRTGIKALLDASVDALDRELHDTFVYLGGMFEPSATPDLLSRVLNSEKSLIAKLLGQLEERGLVISRTSNNVLYYQLHDLAYSYARTIFLNKGWSGAAVITACRDYAADHKLDLDALDVELSNILEAGEAAYQSEQEKMLLDMMRSLAVDGPFFAARGHTNLSLRLMKAAIEVARAHQQIETAHYLLSRLGNTYVDFLGDLRSAYEAYKEALELARALGNQQRQAILLTVIGKVRFLQSLPDADHYYEEAEQIARTSNDDFAMAFVLHHRGYQLLNKPDADYERGRALSDEAATIAERLELPDIHFHSLINRGAAEFELGRVKEALATHQQAHALASTHHNHPWLAYALQSIGEDYDRLQQQEQAQQAFDQALAIWRQTGGKAQAATLTEFMHTHQYTVQPEQV